MDEPTKPTFDEIARDIRLDRNEWIERHTQINLRGGAKLRVTHYPDNGPESFVKLTILVNPLDADGQQLPQQEVFQTRLERSEADELIENLEPFDDDEDGEDEGDPKCPG